MRSASAAFRRQYMVVQNGFNTSESHISLQTWSTTQFSNLNYDKNRFDSREYWSSATLSKLICFLILFWIFGSAVLVAVESDEQKDDKSGVIGDSKARNQFLQTYWKINGVISVNTDHWNNTVDQLLQWFENKQSLHTKKVPLFDSFFGSWLFTMYFANAVGGVPGFSNVELSSYSRLVAIFIAFPSVLLYYWTIYNIARSARLLPRSAIYCFTVTVIFMTILKAWLSYFEHDIFPLIGNGFKLLSILLNYRVFRESEASSTIAITLLVLHGIFWIVLFAMFQTVMEWRNCLYLRIVDRLDAESTLLITLPALKLNRAQHLVQQYSHRSILHRLFVLFLTEKDKENIEKIIAEFQEKPISHGSMEI